MGPTFISSPRIPRDRRPRSPQPNGQRCSRSCRNHSRRTGRAPPPARRRSPPAPKGPPPSPLRPLPSTRAAVPRAAPNSADGRRTAPPMTPTGRVPHWPPRVPTSLLLAKRRRRRPSRAPSAMMSPGRASIAIAARSSSIEDGSIVGSTRLLLAGSRTVVPAMCRPIRDSDLVRSSSVEVGSARLLLAGSQAVVPAAVCQPIRDSKLELRWPPTPYLCSRCGWLA